MKFLILFALAALAVAEPEADPATVYTNGVFHTNVENLQKGVHTQYTGPVGTLYNTHKVIPAPVVHNKVPMTYTYPYVQTVQKPVVYTKPVVYSSPFVQKLFKREAEAESEADPQLVYNTGVTGYPYQTPVAAYPWAPVTYAKPWASTYVKPAYGIYSPYRLYKREAEAESEPEADPWTVYRTGYPLAAAQYPLTTYAQPWTHAAYAKPVYSTYGSVYNPLSYRLFKREAESEPEADPWTVYRTGYPTVASTWSGVYPTTYSTPYVNTPLVHNAWAGVNPYYYHY